MPKVGPNKKDHVFLCGCPLKKCRDRWERYHDGDEDDVFAARTTVRRHIQKALKRATFSIGSVPRSFWPWREDFESKDWYDRPNLIYFSRAAASLPLQNEEDEQVTGSDDEDEDDQSQVIVEEEERRRTREELETERIYAGWEEVSGDGQQEADGVAEWISSFVQPEFDSWWLDGMITRYNVTTAIHMLKEVRLALGKRAALGTLTSIWSGVARVVQDVAIVVPTVAALGQLWRQSRDIYFDLRTCANHHDLHPKGEDDSPCGHMTPAAHDDDPPIVCGDACNVQVFAAKVSDIISLAMYGEEFARGARYGPNLFAETLSSDTEPQFICDVWQSPAMKLLHVDLQHQYGEMNGLIPSATYLPIVIELFADGFNPFAKTTAYSLWAITLRFLNLPPSIRSKYRHLHPLVLISGPKEPTSIDVYLARVVDELNALYKDGLIMYDSHTGWYVQIRVTVLCVAHDTRGNKLVQKKKEWPALQACPFCSNRGYRYEGARGPGCIVYLNCQPYDVIYSDAMIREEVKLAAGMTEQAIRDDSSLGWWGRSPLLNLPVRADTLYTPDFMHAVANTVESAIRFTRPSRTNAKKRPAGLVTWLGTDSGRRWRTSAQFVADVQGSSRIDWLTMDTADVVKRAGEGEVPWECSDYQSAMEFLAGIQTPKQYYGRTSQIYLPIREKEKKKKKRDEADTKMRATHYKDAAVSGLLVAAMFFGGVDVAVCAAYAGVFSLMRRLTDRAVDAAAMSMYGRRDSSPDEEPGERGPSLGAAMATFHRYVPEVESRFSLHMITHLFDSVCKLGPLRDTWSYAFESYFSWLKDLVRNKFRPVASIARALNRIFAIDQALAYLKTSDAGVCPSDTDEESASDWGQASEESQEERGNDDPGEHDGVTGGTNVILPVPLFWGRANNGKPVDLDSDFLRLLRQLYFPRLSKRAWRERLDVLRVNCRHVSTLEDCLALPSAAHISIKRHSRMIIADIHVRLAGPSDDPDDFGLSGTGDSYLTVNSPVNAHAIPGLAQVEGIYEVCIGTDMVHPMDRRLLLSVSLSNLEPVDDQMRLAGLSWFDAFLFRERLRSPVFRLIDVSWIRQQAFLCRFPGEEGEAGKHLVLNKNTLTNMAVQNPFGAQWDDLVASGTI